MNAITFRGMLLGAAVALGAAGGCGRSEQAYEPPEASDKLETSQDAEPSFAETEAADDRPRDDGPAF